MLYVGVFLLGSSLGVLVMGFMAGASRNNQCEDCICSKLSRDNQIDFGKR